MNDTGSGGKASESKHSAPTGTRDVIVRSLPEATYQLLREISFRSGAPYADILAYAMNCAIDQTGEYGGEPKNIAAAFIDQIA